MKDSAQNLELSPDLLRFMDELTAEYGEKPVTMLNLLNFEREGKGAYYRYGQVRLTFVFNFMLGKEMWELMEAYG